jgi:hypothetical protein
MDQPGIKNIQFNNEEIKIEELQNQSVELPKHTIQPQELRIGNLLYFKRFPNVPESFEVIKVTSISKNGFISFVNSDGEKENYFIDCFEPIKITEEILFRFGYEIQKEYNGVSFKRDNFNLWKGNGWDFFLLSISSMNMEGINEFEIEVKFAHQLQNLYFALKGEELQFKQTT